MQILSISIKKSALLLLLISSVFCIKLSVALEDNTRSIKKPHCKARSNMEPGRLNIDTSAKSWGYTQPCEFELILYIAKNTPLRSFDVKIRVLGPKEDMLLERTIHIDLQRRNNGMYQRDYPVEPINEHSCQNLKLKLSSLICRDKRGNHIDCPKIRLKSSTVFQDLLIDDKHLNVCFDN